MKLKKQPTNGYPADRCAAAGCRHDSTRIDATQRLAEIDVPLCDDCYDKIPIPKAKPTSESSNVIPFPGSVPKPVEVDPEPLDETPGPRLADPESPKLFDW